MRRNHGRTRSTAFAVGVLTALAITASATGQTAPATLSVTSSAFTHGVTIPALYTCEGKNISPPLAWSEPPRGTKSFALVMDDPDSPDPKLPVRTWVHWIVYDLPDSTRSLDEGVQTLPPGAAQGKNDRRESHYDGPCPAIGMHRYFFKVYALDVVLPASLGTPTKDELEQAMKGHVLLQGELMGVYALRPR